MSRHPHQIFQEEETERLKKEYQHIMQLEVLSPDELWEIKDENFYKWVCKYYYPRLLKHFRENLKLFDQWQKVWNLTDERIIQLGITSCIESNGNKENIYKYIIERESRQGKQIFVSKVNLDGKVKHGGPYFTYTHMLIESFVSYFDWFAFQVEKQNERIAHNDLLQFASKSGIDRDSIQVSLQNKFRMLKMGGTTIRCDNLEILNTKLIEFANLSRLVLTGKIATQNKDLTIKNSYIDDLIVVDCEMFQVTFYRCKLNNLKIVNSKLNTWNFIECEVVGEVSDSELMNVNIRGGLFDVIFRDNKLYNVHGAEKRSNNRFTSAYIALRQAYKNQGEDALEQYYYIREKENLRKSIIPNFSSNFKKNNIVFIGNKKSIKLVYAYVVSQFKNLKLIYTYLMKSINFYYWGYGFKPLNVLKSSVLIVLLFSIFYVLQFANFSFSQINIGMIVDSIKTSLSAFSTLGYFTDDVQNIDDTGIIIESVIGGLSVGAFIASASNMKI
jgi:hypothetical protein